MIKEYSKTDITYIFEKSDINQLFISLITCGIESRDRVASQCSFKVYVYNEKHSQHHCRHCHLTMNEFPLVYDIDKKIIIKSNFKNSMIKKRHLS